MNNGNYGGGRGQSSFRGKRDRFQNPTALIGCKPNKNGYPVGYLRVPGVSGYFKLEPSRSNKEGVEAWIRVTYLKENSNQRNNGFN